MSELCQQRKSLVPNCRFVSKVRLNPSARFCHSLVEVQLVADVNEDRIGQGAEVPQHAADKSVYLCSINRGGCGRGHPSISLSTSLRALVVGLNA